MKRRSVWATLLCLAAIAALAVAAAPAQAVVDGQLDGDTRAQAAAGDLLYTLQTHVWDGEVWERGVAGGVDSTGNYYAGGSGETAEGTTGYLAAKLTPAGALDWLLPWVPTAGVSGEEYASDVAVSPSGEMIIVGSVAAIGGGTDVQLVSRDAVGALAWTATWSGPGQRPDAAAAVARADDGSLYVVGSSTARDGDGDVIALKFGPTGELAWARRYNGRWDEEDGASAVCLYKNSVYVGAMVTHGGQGTDAVLIKYDTAGVRKWVRRYDGSRHNYDTVAEVVANRNSVYVAGGVTTLKGPQNMVRRYRPSGAFVWMRVSGAGGLEDYPVWSDVALTPSGDAVVTGEKWMGTGYDWATTVYRPSGVLAWSRRVSTRGYDGGTAVAVDPAGKIYVAGSCFRGGTREGDGTVVCYGPGGTRRWMTSTGLPDFDTLFDISLSSDRVYGTGDSYDPTYLGEFVVVEFQR
jgi:hypothetical protein